MVEGETINCKKKVSDFPVPSRDVTNQTLPERELLNYSPPGRVWLVTFRLGTRKSLTFFTVYGTQRKVSWKTQNHTKLLNLTAL
jgi:hypothetical protein